MSQITDLVLRGNSPGRSNAGAGRDPNNLDVKAHFRSHPSSIPFHLLPSFSHTFLYPFISYAIYTSDQAPGPSKPHSPHSYTKPARPFTMRAISGFQALSYIFLALAQLSRASTSQQSVPILAFKPPNIDAISFLSSRSQDQDSIFNEAVKILDSMKSSPSCNRLAATKLVNSCQTFNDGRDGVQNDSPETLDLLRSVYAARLALCEIDGCWHPNASLVPSCHCLTSTTEEPIRLCESAQRLRACLG